MSHSRGARASGNLGASSHCVPTVTGAVVICQKRLRAVLVTPLSGPLARYGRSGATALRLWASQAGVDLAIADAYPSAAATVASVAAQHRIDVLFGPYGAGPAVAAARAATTVLWNHGGASDRGSAPGSARARRGLRGGGG